MSFLLNGSFWVWVVVTPLSKVAASWREWRRGDVTLPTNDRS